MLPFLAVHSLVSANRASGWPGGARLGRVGHGPIVVRLDDVDRSSVMKVTHETQQAAALGPACKPANNATKLRQLVGVISDGVVHALW